MAKKQKRTVVITTDKDRRGVFCGELVRQSGNTVVLANAQMAVYWPKEQHGVLGLAKDGPKNGSRISPVVSRLKVDGVTLVMDTSVEAIKKWRAEPWD